MSHLIICRGIPGSGKSTKAKSFGMVHFEADQFFTDEMGNYNWKAEYVSSAHKWCYEEVTRNLSYGIPVVVSNTFTKISEMQKYIDFCKENEIPFTVIKCVGDFKNQHSVPENVLQAMKARWQDYEGEEIYDPRF